jgi:hypothetical protein
MLLTEKKIQNNIRIWPSKRKDAGDLDGIAKCIVFTRIKNFGRHIIEKTRMGGSHRRNRRRKDTKKMFLMGNCAIQDQ